MSYEITFRPRADKALDRLPPGIQQRIISGIAALAEKPRGKDTKALKGDLKGMRRLRVGEYRVLYVADDGARTVDILRIGPRGDFYD